jgi:hypothetical protein
MKKVIMLRSLGGDGWKLGKGAITELEDELAIGWDSAGVCTILDDVYAKPVKRFHIPHKHETMERGPEETAVVKPHFHQEQPKEVRRPDEKPKAIHKPAVTPKKVSKPIVPAKKITVKKKK